MFFVNHPMDKDLWFNHQQFQILWFLKVTIVILLLLSGNNEQGKKSGLFSSLGIQPFFLPFQLRHPKENI